MRDGLSIQIRVTRFPQMHQFLRRVIKAGIVRCDSPMRKQLCNQPATHVFWQDAGEWYSCCDTHRIVRENGHPSRQWTGFTRFAPHMLDVPVIPDKAQAWIQTLGEFERAQIKYEEYARET
ncbi:hypothetical protein ANRL1_02876 [Anaerolineae bacterium]|nr:hypothetical protein ANRL1_02876 [Anaerolineae bacterium]